ncbi:MAG: hypothetical protein K2L02_04115 [Clostridia bacterium]|nr:hypothetical protein [Clostridia bacterium]
MRETKTVQVYPSDAIVNATIEEYGSFGWEVIGNQRCQEYEGQTHGTDGRTTNHYSSFNKITFTREKSAAWYDAVSDLEKEYHAAGDTISSYKRYKPVLRELEPIGGVMFAVEFSLYFWGIIPGIIFSIVRASVRADKKKKYQKQYREALTRYEQEYPAKIKELEGKRSELRARSEKLILGKE